LASLVAVLLVTTILGPVGTAAAVQGITVTQQADNTTVNPGDTITFTTTVDVDGGDNGQIDANSIGLQEDLPDGWTVTSRTNGTNFQAGPDGWLWFAFSGVNGTDTVTYTVEVPNDAESTDYTVSVTASTEKDANTTTETTITVQDATDDNTPPTIDPISDQSVTEGESATVSVNTSDDDGDSVTLSLTQSPDFVSLSDGEITIAPESGDAANSPYTVEVTADDGTDTTTESFEVTVEEPAPNTPPTIDAITDTGVSEGGSTTVDVSASDADSGDSLSLSVSGPDWVSLTDNGDGTGTIELAPSGGLGNDILVGDYVIEVTVSDGDASATEAFAVYVDEPDQDGTVVFAVNAGGSAYTAGDGTEYQADTNFDGGSTFSTNQAIDDTQDDVLYQTERYGDPFGYDIPVSESGTYEVTLKFAEIFQGAASQDSPDSTTPPNDGTNENDRLFSASIEGQTVVSEYDIFSEVGPLTATDKTYTVEVTDGTLNVDFSATNDNAKISAITVEQLSVEEQETSAEVAINPDSGVEASTYGGGSYQVTNTGDTNIQTLTLDLSETMLPDMVFDPFNTAGDDVGKEFTLDSGDVTVQNVEYTNFHNGVDNEAGYDTIVVTLSGFEPGETMTFSVDNDPTVIDTTDLGSQAAGPVSGLEITGGTVSVDSGSGPVEATIVGDGSAGGSMATVQEDTSESEPSIGVQGVTLSSTTLSDRHSAATVPSASQTITISGAPANAEVTLLRVEGELNLNDVPEPYDLEEYEANDANQVQYYAATTDSNGEATVDVTLTDNPDTGVDESGLNYFTAWVVEPDGDTGPISNYAILQLNAPPTADAGPDQTVDEDTTVTLDATGSSDSDGSIASYSWTVTDDAGTDVTLSDTSAAQPTFTAPEVDGDQTLTFEVEVTDDDGSTATDTVSVAVQDTDPGIPPIGDFENAPTDPDGDGLYEDVNGDGSVDSGDAQTIFANTDDPVVENNVAAFDFNDDGDVNVGDAQALFVEV
jgi:hypothetical protein